ncbi:hypothetical protein MKW98_022368, partial [Papaver atlanticum]
NEAPTDFYILVTGTSCAQEWSRTGCRRANVGDGTIILNNLLQHLKEMNDPVTQGVLTETENMLAHGLMENGEWRSETHIAVWKLDLNEFMEEEPTSLPHLSTYSLFEQNHINSNKVSSMNSESHHSKAGFTQS